MGNTVHSAYTSKMSQGKLINVIIAIAIVAVCWDLISLILLVKNYSIAYWLFLHVLLFLKVGGLWLFYSRRQPGWYLLTLLAAYDAAAALTKMGLGVSAHSLPAGHFDPLSCLDLFLAAALLVTLLQPAARALFKINAGIAGIVIAAGALLAGALIFCFL
ncbi:hypothetical protein ACTHGU_15025 [Chitinophagaceae bacterium MMS25-I14]